MKISASPLSALVVSNDPDVLFLARILESQGFRVIKASSGPHAQQQCKETRFDLAVYDHDIIGVLLEGWQLHVASPRVIVAVVQASKLDQISGKRVHFTLQKPFSSDLFAKTLKAAYGQIALDRRVTFRHRIAIKTNWCRVVVGGVNRELDRATIVNLSQTGLCLQTSEMLPQAATVEMGVALPENNAVLRVRGEIIWAQVSGRAGIKFVGLGREEKQQLQGWLTSRLPASDDMLPRLPSSNRVAGQKLAAVYAAEQRE